MRTKRITTNLPVEDIEASKGFYTDFLGLHQEEFNLGWGARFTDPESGAHVQRGRTRRSRCPPTTSTRRTRRRSGSATRSSTR